ncbi:hypothetical protein GCM10010916_36020 [Paenibacillus abyssi]|uniref:Uncharacterized protein n=1 Tax=Paenibacillus abyssi TaxID=1340531 RepID=A0A917G053_9BACL|nr:hypothetical protein GCM10010916_36020 [Paenibacillus abyssi]
MLAEDLLKMFIAKFQKKTYTRKTGTALTVPVGLKNGEGETERTALAGLALNADGAVMRLYNRLTDREA